MKRVTPNVEEGSTLTNFNYATAGSGTGFVSGTDKEKSQLVDAAFKEWAQTEDFFDGPRFGWCRFPVDGADILCGEL